MLFDPLFLDCHAIGNDLSVDRDELGSVPLNRTCGHSTSAWCQLGNRLRIVNGGSGQWKRLRSRMGHALDDDDAMLLCVYCTIFNSSYGCHTPIKRIVWKRNATVAMVRSSLCVFRVQKSCCDFRNWKRTSSLRWPPVSKRFVTDRCRHLCHSLTNKAQSSTCCVTTRHARRAELVVRVVPCLFQRGGRRRSSSDHAYKFSLLCSGFASISVTTSGKSEVNMSTPIDTGDAPEDLPCESCLSWRACRVVLSNKHNSTSQLLFFDTVHGLDSVSWRAVMQQVEFGLKMHGFQLRLWYRPACCRWIKCYHSWGFSTFRSGFFGPLSVTLLKLMHVRLTRSIQRTDANKW